FVFACDVLGVCSCMLVVLVFSVVFFFVAAVCGVFAVSLHTLFRSLIGMREKLAFDGPKLPKALNELGELFGCEAVILSTCNRIELYIARTGALVSPDADLIAEYLAQFHQLPYETIRPNLYAKSNQDAVEHL